MVLVLELPDESETLCFSVMTKKSRTPIAVGAVNCITGKLTECDVSMHGETPDMLDDSLIQHVGYTPEQCGYDK